MVRAQVRQRFCLGVCDGHGHHSGGKLLAALPGVSPGLRSSWTELSPLISQKGGLALLAQTEGLPQSILIRTLKSKNQPDTT